MQNSYCFLQLRIATSWMMLTIHRAFCCFILCEDPGWLRWLESDDFLRSFLFNVVILLQIINPIFSSELLCLVSFVRGLAFLSIMLDFVGLSEVCCLVWFKDFFIVGVLGELWRVWLFDSHILTTPTENRIFIALSSLCAQ